MTTTTHGRPRIPRKAATDPGKPRNRAPTAIDRLTMLGPGKNWQSARVSRNSRSVSHLRSSTSLRRAHGNTPPKATAEISMKWRNKSHRPGFCAAADSEGSTSAVMRRPSIVVGGRRHRRAQLLAQIPRHQRLVEPAVAVVNVVAKLDGAVGGDKRGLVKHIDRDRLGQRHRPGLAGVDRRVDRFQRPGAVANQKA